MLYMTRMFQFCSISHQQGLQILNLMREAFDEEDLETMKTFVRDELESDTNFHYTSGRVCSRMNLGQIVKIAIELRNITQKALDDQDSGEEEDEETQESLEKRSKQQGWFHFCQTNVAAIEKVWTRKLEQPEEQQPAMSDVPEPSNNEDHESTIENMLEKISKGGRVGRVQSARPPASTDSALLDDIRNGREQSNVKDDFTVEYKVNEFGDNQFWRAPEMYNIDDLLADMSGSWTSGVLIASAVVLLPAICQPTRSFSPHGSYLQCSIVSDCSTQVVLWKCVLTCKRMMPFPATAAARLSNLAVLWARMRSYLSDDPRLCTIVPSTLFRFFQDCIKTQPALIF